jgi:hypothetical protein
MKSITDKAELSLDFPDKTYMGSFGRESSYEVRVEPEDVLLRLVRDGAERRQVALHLHYYLLADILKEIGEGMAEQKSLDSAQLDAFREPVEALAAALKTPASKRSHGRKSNRW